MVRRAAKRDEGSTDTTVIRSKDGKIARVQPDYSRGNGGMRQAAPWVKGEYTPNDTAARQSAAKNPHSFAGRDAQFNDNAKLDPSRVTKRVTKPDDGVTPSPSPNKAPLAPLERPKTQGSAMARKDPKRQQSKGNTGKMQHSFGKQNSGQMKDNFTRQNSGQMKEDPKLSALLRAARKTK